MNQGRRRMVLVTGQSGAGKATILGVLEDLGFQAVDNPPVTLLEALFRSEADRLAVGIDVRTTGFDPTTLLETIRRLRETGSRRIDLVFATAAQPVLLRRFTATRRRHPLAREGRVVAAIEEEVARTLSLRAASDIVIDTSELPVAALRRLVRERLAGGGPGELSLTLVSFGFPHGLPPEADMVFDARFLKNPHYDPMLRPMDGRCVAVADHVRADPDYSRFLSGIESLTRLVLPRFIREGKTYATLAIGCSGGRHRSVTLIEELASRLRSSVVAPRDEMAGIRTTVLHRELEGERDRSSLPAETPGHQPRVAPVQETVALP